MKMPFSPVTLLSRWPGRSWELPCCAVRFSANLHPSWAYPPVLRAFSVSCWNICPALMRLPVPLYFIFWPLFSCLSGCCSWRGGFIQSVKHVTPGLWPSRIIPRSAYHLVYFRQHSFCPFSRFEDFASPLKQEWNRRSDGQVIQGVSIQRIKYIESLLHITNHTGLL